MFTMRLVEFEGARITYSGFACKSWNERHHGDETLVGLQIYFLYQDTLANHTRSEVKKSLVWTAACNVPPASLEPSPPHD
jgi:hypothetical protein